MGLLFKLIYTALLIGVTGLAVRELWTVWFDTRVYIGNFEVVSDSGKDEAASVAFPKRIIAAQTILAQQLIDYQARHAANAASDTTYAISGMPPLQLPPEALSGIDITVQTINLRQVLTAVRRGFLAPNEVSGHVTLRPGSVLAAVDWPSASPRADGGPPLTRFLAPSRATEQETAAYIACSISWARAAAGDAGLAAFPRAQICDFGAALGDFYALEDKASTGSGLDAAQTSQVRRRAALLRSHYGGNAVFPEIYRLRADLLDFLPEATRTTDELVEAQEDRLRYAMLSPELRDLPAETKRMAALALARPAILLDNGKVKDARDNWAGLLNRHAPDISAAAAATGILVESNGQPVGTGFIVGPGLMMTASYVMDVGSRPPNAEMAADDKRMRFCLGSSAADCADALPVGEILYDGSKHGHQIALVAIPNHDAVLHAPLGFADPLPKPNELIGRYAYVVGYPFKDGRMPVEFVRRLLGKADGQKRLMPGRILGFGALGPGIVGTDVQRTGFTTDISTMTGSGGGPLVDLETGKVIGLSYAGLWHGQRGKFAYAMPIPREVLDRIAAKIRGDDGSLGAATPAAVPPN